MLTRDRAAEIFDRIKKILVCGRDRSAFFRRANLLSPVLPTIRFIRMLRKKTTSSQFARSLAGERLGLLPTSLMTKDCGRVVASSEALARVQHPDPDLLPMPDLSKLQATRIRMFEPYKFHPATFPRLPRSLLNFAPTA